MKKITLEESSDVNYGCGILQHWEGAIICVYFFGVLLLIMKWRAFKSIVSIEKQITNSKEHLII
jgi:hypothetical protein